MKICFLMPFHISERGGGAEVQTWLLARELAQRGFEVSYVAQSMSNKAGTRETIDGVTVVWLPYVHHFRWRACPRYYRALRKLSPDVAVVRVTSYLVGVAGHYCRRHGKKFIWMCADNLSPHKWHGLLAQHSHHGAMTLKQRLYAYFNAVVDDLIRIYGDRYVTHPMTQNNVQREAYRKSFGKDSLRMISGHAPPSALTPPLDRLSDGIVLWVANLGPRKQPEKFLDLARACAGFGLKFIMIGGRADQDYLDRLFSDKPDNLEWLGKLPFDECLSWFDKAAFFVNTSTMEGFPNTYIQSWLRGVPTFCLGADPDGVIAVNGLGGVAEKIEDLADMILALKADPDRYPRMAVDVRNYAKARHTVEKAVDHLLDNLGAGPR